LTATEPVLTKPYRAGQAFPCEEIPHRISWKPYKRCNRWYEVTDVTVGRTDRTWFLHMAFFLTL